MKKFTVKKGKHSFKSWNLLERVARYFPIFNYTSKEFTWECQFEESCRYLLEGNEQDDWNKGGGLTSAFTSNREDSLMWAWRYIPSVDYIEIAFYINKSDKSFEFESLGFVQIGQKFTLKYSFNDEDEMFIDFSALSNTIEVTELYRKVSIIKARWIPLWFGGSNSAPNTMSANWWRTKNKK